MFGIINNLSSSHVIVIIDGIAKAKKGRMTSSLLADVTEACAMCSIEKGTIWINKEKQLSFSSAIPSSYHQRFKNVVSASNGLIQ